MFTRKSVKTKLFLTLLFVSIVPLMIVSFILYYQTNQGFKNILRQNMMTTKNTISAQLHRASEELLSLTEYYAKDQQLINTFLAGDRDQLSESARTIFERLSIEHYVDVFEFGDTSGVVFLRGHNLEKFGDDKSHLPAIQVALANGSTAGFEFGNSGLAVRAFAPLIQNDEVVGTLQTGLDDHVIQSIVDSITGAQLNIMNREGEILVSTDENRVGYQFEDETIINKSIAGKEVFRELDTYMEYFMPLYDPTGADVIGMIQINQDATFVKNLNQNIILYVLLVGLSTVGIVIIVALLSARGFSQPIQRLTAVMGKIADGELNSEIQDINRHDEIGQLSKSVSVTQANLKNMIEKISTLSSVVKKQSALMKNGCDELNEGSVQVASAMQAFAAGSEQQANTSSALAEQMGQFSDRIKDASKNGALMLKSTDEVLKITKNGNQLMDQSVEQMIRIYELVKEAAEKMTVLDHHSKKISSLINMIQEIADQTNLLALNAAIEAARAGENGRGFAVVASEVRNLAEQVSVSIHEITSIVNNIQADSSSVAASLTKGYNYVDEGAKQIQITGKEFENINHSFTQLISKVVNINDHLTEIDKKGYEINASIENIASVSEEYASSIGGTTDSVAQMSQTIGDITTNAKHLDDLSEELENMVKLFKLE